MNNDYLTEAELDATFIDNTDITMKGGMWVGICNDQRVGITIYSFRTAKDAYEWIKSDMSNSQYTEKDENGNVHYYVITIV